MTSYEKSLLATFAIGFVLPLLIHQAIFLKIAGAFFWSFFAATVFLIRYEAPKDFIAFASTMTIFPALSYLIGWMLKGEPERAYLKARFGGRKNLIPEVLRVPEKPTAPSWVFRESPAAPSVTPSSPPSAEIARPVDVAETPPRPAAPPAPPKPEPPPVERQAVPDWPTFSSDEPAPPPAVLETPEEAAPPPPAKRPRGRPRKIAAKSASTADVVKSPVIEPPPALPPEALPGPSGAKEDPPQVDPPEPPVVDLPKAARPPAPAEAAEVRPWDAAAALSWARPVLFEHPTQPPPAPSIAARRMAIDALTSTPTIPTVSPFERLLTRPAVIESTSPSGVVRIRIVGWPARILTAYRATQLSILLSVFFFYDSIFEWIGARIVLHSGPLVRGALCKGYKLTFFCS